jgi:hypothetical protein
MKATSNCRRKINSASCKGVCLVIRDMKNRSRILPMGMATLIYSITLPYFTGSIYSARMIIEGSMTRFERPVFLTLVNVH